MIKIYPNLLIGEVILNDFVSKIMTRTIITCKPYDSILEVRDIMWKSRLSRVVISEEQKKASGIITHKDIIKFLINDKSNRSLEEIQANEVMSKNLITASPDTMISAAARSMISNRISSLIVLNEDDYIEGIITKSDLNLYFAGRGVGIYKVSDFMTKDPRTVRSSHPIFVVSRIMSEHQISRIIVTDQETKPVGIITLADMASISNLLRPPSSINQGELVLAGGTLILPRGIYLLTARDFMTAHPISIKKDADLSEAAKLMSRHAISGLPVIDGFNLLVGVITKTDIAKAIASLK